MDDLHCNRLTCRKLLNEKAVVTTCSHIYCVECATEIFSSSTGPLICAACETILDQPDDVVICSLHPTNDYKTSILSGLSPATILEICNRAVSFWQYQIHQESSFQQAILRNVNERNAQMQKQLENVVREANSELSLLNNKLAGLERDLELERRKNRDLVESAKEKDAEYQKLKGQLDKMKRKALLAPNALSVGDTNPTSASGGANTGLLGDLNRSGGTNNAVFGSNGNGGQSRLRNNVMQGGDPRGGASGGVMSNMVHGMEANKIQRTPIRQGLLNAANQPSSTTLQNSQNSTARSGWHAQPQVPSGSSSSSVLRSRHHSAPQPPPSTSNFQDPASTSSRHQQQPQMHRSSNTSNTNHNNMAVDSFENEPQQHASLASNRFVPPQPPPQHQHQQPHQQHRRGNGSSGSGGGSGGNVMVSDSENGTYVNGESRNHTRRGSGGSGSESGGHQRMFGSRQPPGAFAQQQPQQQSSTSKRAGGFRPASFMR